MRFEAIRITNYKSFEDSGWIDLSPGINVVVGENGSGKSALIEILNPREATSTPHRSPANVSLVRMPNSSVTYRVFTSGDEIRQCTIRSGGAFETFVPVHRYSRQETVRVGDSSLSVIDAFHSNSDRELTSFVVALLSSNIRMELVHAFDNEGWQSTTFPPRWFEGEGVYGLDWRHVTLAPNISTQSFDTLLSQAGHANAPFRDGITRGAWQRSGEAVFGLFTSQPKVGACPHSIYAERLKADGSNLAAHLTTIKSRRRRDNIEEGLRSIFPQCKGFTVTSGLHGSENTFTVNLAFHDSDGDDLSFPLNDCGTGYAQVLLLLTIITSPEPSILILDEPFTHLHPAAAKKLAGFIRQYPQHQYVISTHSPEVINALKPDRIIRVDRDPVSGKSTAKSINAGSLPEMRSLLRDLGVSLADVFGFEKIVFVEGETEQECFDYILRANEGARAQAANFVVAKKPSEKWRGSRVHDWFERYRSIIESTGLLTPDYCFSFDREDSSPEDRTRIESESSGKVHFIPGRMFEDFLLSERAIVAVLTEQNFPPSDAGLDVAGVLTQAINAGETLHAANLLKDIFSKASDAKLEYNKPRHGLMLTKWLLKNEPETIEPLVKYVLDLARPAASSNP